MWLLNRGHETGVSSPSLVFTSEGYQRHNRRRQEHLASLELPITGKTVLELGAGIGDHSSFFLDRGCALTVTDAREDNLEVVKQRYPMVPSFVLDIETASPQSMPQHQIVYSYGLLYHLNNPSHAISLFSEWSSELLLLETWVSFGKELAINIVAEDGANASQAASGVGCRPTRAWLRAELQKRFEYVYAPITQPSHAEFPTDWTRPQSWPEGVPSRAVFVASRQALSSDRLTLELPDFQAAI
jgi:hypothetical protein